MYQIILASGSPRRKEIMDIMGIPCEVVSADVDETVDQTEPLDMVQALAALKTKAVLDKLESESVNRDVLVIGADTMVFYRDQALGKPRDEADAARMLQMLSDDVHEVYTGVSIRILKDTGKQEEIAFASCTKVYVQPLTQTQIKEYIATGEPMDKAGAYAIQGQFGIHIKEIIGDYYNVVGFPISQIYYALLEKGINIKKLK